MPGHLSPFLERGRHTGAMPRHSAGLLPYTVDESGLHVFLAHIGGPYWARKDEAAWTVVKGELDPGEDPRATARCEWVEETGTPVPEGDWIDLGEVRQSGGKVVTAFAVEAPGSLAFVASNEVEVEWPPRSGRRVLVPEVDRAEWCSLEQAELRLVKGQRPLLQRLSAALT